MSAFWLGESLSSHPGPSTFRSIWKTAYASIAQAKKKIKHFICPVFNALRVHAVN